MSVVDENRQVEFAEELAGAFTESGADCVGVRKGGCGDGRGREPGHGPG
ncbi:MAG: hypothetical protein ACREQ5_01055 [Candidatus Dormibacteria bacterium]